jgi:hypothetical protein
MVFVLTGFAGLCLGIFAMREVSAGDRGIAITCCTVFLLAGLWLLRQTRAVMVFDKREGVFWRTPGSETSGVRYPLERVHALQLLAERMRSSSRRGGSYYSYELNVVLDDGKRVHIVDHGKRPQIEADAAALGEFLEKPIWNALGDRR